MKAEIYMRRLLALVCLVAILLAVLGPITLVVLFAFLIPVWFFFADVVISPIASAQETCASPIFGFFSVFSPRPPPIR
jgi:hypothetical protein